jgi:hypothetical protein
MDLTTNGVVITDAIKFVQTNSEKLTTMSTKEDNNSSKEPREATIVDSSSCSTSSFILVKDIVTKVIISFYVIGNTVFYD